MTLALAPFRIPRKLHRHACAAEPPAKKQSPIKTTAGTSQAGIPSTRQQRHESSSRLPSIKMFEARLTQGSLIKKLIESIRELVTDANFDVSSTGLALQVSPRNLLPLCPMPRSAGADSIVSPGHGYLPRFPRLPVDETRGLWALQMRSLPVARSQPCQHHQGAQVRGKWRCHHPQGWGSGRHSHSHVWEPK